MGAALTTCAAGRAVLLKPGRARALIADLFFSTSAFLRWTRRIWREVLPVTEHEPQCAQLHELPGAQKMEQVSCHQNSPANSSFQVKPSHISGGKHVLWGQLGTKLQPQNAFWRSPSSLQEDMEGPQGSLPLPPHSFLCFITFPPALMGTIKWRVKRQDAGESKQDRVALLRFSPSVPCFTLVFTKTRSYFLDGKRQ